MVGEVQDHEARTAGWSRCAGLVTLLWVPDHP